MNSNEKAFGILSYFWLLFLVPLLAGGGEFSRYHANQGLVLFIVEAILGVIVTIACLVIGIIPVIGAIIAGIISGVSGLIMLAYMIIGIYHAAQGEMKPLPIIGAITIIR